MFCTNCGTSLVDTARFCSVCGTQVPGTGAREPQRPQGAPPPAASGYQQQGHNSPPAHQQSVYSPQSLYAQPNQSPQVGINTYAIFASSGHPQAAFDQIAGAIFHALDRNIEVSFQSAATRLSGLLSKQITFRKYKRTDMSSLPHSPATPAALRSQS